MPSYFPARSGSLRLCVRAGYFFGIIQFVGSFGCTDRMYFVRFDGRFSAFIYRRQKKENGGFARRKQVILRF